VARIPGIDLCCGKRSVSLLEEILRREKFDVIHGHYLLSPLAHWGVYFGKKMGIATVFTHHSVTRFFPKRLMLFLCPYLMVPVGMLFFRSWVLLRHIIPDVITAVSYAVATDTGDIYRTKSVEILPNGIDPMEWRLQKEPHDHFSITSVMRLNKPKYPRELVRVIPLINEKLGGVRPRVRIVGEGPERKKLEKDIARLGLQDQVQLLGYQPRSEIRKIFTTTDLFVLPTLREGFGIAILEARMAGIPVVAMNHGGVGEFIQHGKDGYLANDYPEFVSYIVQLIQNQKLREQMTATVQEPLQGFTWDTVIRRHLEIYQRAIDKRVQHP